MLFAVHAHGPRTGHANEDDAHVIVRVLPEAPPASKRTTLAFRSPLSSRAQIEDPFGHVVYLLAATHR